VQRLEEVFEELGEKTKGKTCQAMKGLIEEGSEVLRQMAKLPLSMQASS
jgi:ferritin-like metal-binding protein YciE